MPLSQIIDTANPTQHSAAGMEKGGGSRWFLVVPALLLIAGAIVFLIRSRESTALAATTTREIAEPVTVIYPQVHAGGGDISLPSTLQAIADSPIFARSSGYLAHWYADIGTHVRKGNCSPSSRLRKSIRS